MTALRAGVVLAALAFVDGASATHAVFVEGNCLVPPFGSPGPSSPGTCGDFDGDGFIGSVEDGDGDRVFGTITRALADTGDGGAVTIVTTGLFAEGITVTAPAANVTLQAASGVEAVVGAVLAGDPGNDVRRRSIGVTVDAPSSRHVVLRNLTIRGWATGIDVRGDSRVTLDAVRVEDNGSFGVVARGSSRVAVTHSRVHGTRGTGIAYSGASRGVVAFSVVTGSGGAGIIDRSRGSVCVSSVVVFDNNRDLVGVRRC